MKIGYFLSCEEYGPRELVRQAGLARDAGIDRLWISDHYHPWNDEQGESPFVWSVIGALATAVPRMHVTAAVTCMPGTAGASAPMTDQTNGLSPCSSFQGW